MDKLMKKLESMDGVERDKLRKMLNEKKSSEKSGKSESEMGWMYKGDRPDDEEYLLGRRIDRHIDNHQEQQDEAAKDAPGALFAEVVAKRADLDMQAKMREDPLYAIRKKEEESRRRLLENPIKMKQLERELEKRKSEDDKKKKKKKKKRHDSSSDEDDAIMKKYLAILEQKEKQKNSSETNSDKKKNSSLHRKEKRRHHSSSSSSDSEEDREKSRKNYDKAGRSSHRQDGQKNYGLIVPKSKEQHKSSHRRRSRSRSRSPVRKSSSKRERSPDRSSYNRSKYNDRSRPPREPPKKKLTAEEREAKLKEMMADAEWREKQRSHNVKRYEEEDKHEEELNKKHTGSSEKFLNPMMASHASQSSVEDRIKRNKYNVQRTQADLDKAFTKR